MDIHENEMDTGCGAIVHLTPALVPYVPDMSIETERPDNQEPLPGSDSIVNGAD